MECLSYCVAERIQLLDLERTLRKNKQIQVIKQWRAIEILDRQHSWYICVFANGTLVSWNLKRHQMPAYFDLIRPSCVQPLAFPLFDGFSYKIHQKTAIFPHEFFNIDCFHLEEDDHELMLSLSYGLSQSIKLKYYEERLEALIERYTPLTRELSTHGKLSMSHKRIQKIIGDILSVKGELNLTSYFLYQPKFFWQHPSLETYFLMVERYMDIPKRTEALNQQLNTLNEIFLMCNGYLENRHSSRLELIIIVLIAFEILFNVLNLHF